MAADAADPGVDSLLHLTRPPAFLDAVGVAATVAEFEWVRRDDMGVHLFEGARVHEKLEVLLMAHGKVAIAPGADPVVSRQGIVVGRLLALTALGPDPLRDVTPDARQNPGFHSLEPAHLLNDASGRGEGVGRR